jgi:hypothetical protein
LYAGAKSPGKDKESNWLPRRRARSRSIIRCYWASKAISMALDAAAGREGEVTESVE